MNIWVWQWFLLWRADLSGCHQLYEAWLLPVFAFFAAWKSANADTCVPRVLVLASMPAVILLCGFPFGCIGRTVASMFKLQCCACILRDHLVLFVSLHDNCAVSFALNINLRGTLACRCYIRLHTPQNAETLYCMYRCWPHPTRSIYIVPGY